MSTINHGMNIDEVEALGRLLQTKGDQLRHLTNEVESVLGRTIWDGPDAAAFKQQWWPDHRGRLQAVAEQVHGFGQSALNNASEQRTASGVAPSSAAASGGRVVPGGDPGQSIPVDPVTPVAAGAIGGLAGSLLGPRTWQEVQRAYESADMGYYRAGGDSSYQCTAWANFRWRELGYDGFVGGNGWEMAGRAPGEVSTTPTLGAIASTDQAHNHVMIVEEIATGPSGESRIRVSEMNTGSDGSGWQQGNPQEFSDQSWFVQRGDAWVRETSGRVYGPLSFAGFPG